MTTLTLLFGAAVFLILLLAFMFLLTAQTSPQSAMLEQVALERRLRRRVPGGDSNSKIVEWVARPFGYVRGLFSQQPDPVLARRLANAGYRQPAHADIFLGTRLGVPAVLCVLVVLLFQESTILFLIIAAVIAWFDLNSMQHQLDQVTAHLGAQLDDAGADAAKNHDGPGALQRSGRVADCVARALRELF